MRLREEGMITETGPRCEHNARNDASLPGAAAVIYQLPRNLSEREDGHVADPSNRTKRLFWCSLRADMLVTAADEKRGQVISCLLILPFRLNACRCFGRCQHSRAFPGGVACFVYNGTPKVAWGTETAKSQEDMAAACLYPCRPVSHTPMGERQDGKRSKKPQIQGDG